MTNCVTNCVTILRVNWNIMVIKLVCNIDKEGCKNSKLYAMSKCQFKNSLVNSLTYYIKYKKLKITYDFR